ncbi:MAG: hypothetical protein A2744_03130 [Candidatus Buchananbacteria bacterium RIFCSPHIGHO2_01_FULL_44_11]|uniref:Uncharacterized protein n=1 Tax=Candidatus Buchananbacteria bacterium RIFCSPHIGHO2_01_FULL_44_11 TaxID=1797535 RepID=A0A1G1Y0B2_9BACT|nr:MAG: hypothetical protein A2744_03130 [Candidatus Buchananbacteria bacterium RIFCSPHIGHO2_01_FULL_44_11]
MASAVVEEIKIPPEIQAVSISVGLPNPEDGDSRRRVCVSYSEHAAVVPATYFFEHETEGLGPAAEEVLVDKLIRQLGRQGFKETSRKQCRETEGYFVDLSRE